MKENSSNIKNKQQLKPRVLYIKSTFDNYYITKD